MNNCIYMAMDKHYEKYTIPCLKSIFKNWINHPKIFLYNNDELSEELTNLIKDKNVVIVKYHPYTFSNLGPVGNNIVYLKYKCWSTDFINYDNVLHLDCDTLILKPLDEIFTTNSLFISNNETLKIKCFKSQEVDMCNAGVFIVNKRHRSDLNEQLLKTLTLDYMDDMCYADQSIISLWCKLQKISLSNEVYYNFQPQFINYKTSSNSPAYDFDKIKILHFAARKPDTIEFHTWWRCDGWQKRYYDLWREYK